MPLAAIEFNNCYGLVPTQSVGTSKALIFKTAIGFWKEQGIPIIAGECILRFAEPVATFHKFHRWIWGLFGKLPH